ncbi:Histidine kinase-, DNA gyrase B-, and HSP90-like ATPase [Halopenitus malekzadehii]|uniref:histidine kinase n=1 Tax=Halopenitus malekzadehii TaxID=1267564 RepID=A0A1H6I3Y3_9EURY|nr:histidine kinase N-terminal 7TM domain-containing protein [Halopenitus malekzadehii]SEH43627.1 Histidine kinase-, DNA gyrase B-, and HSP90-like ATPase [Halopenitus malekzadehii]
MALSAGTVGVGYLALGSALLFLLREPLRHPDTPGSRGFALAVLGISLWPIGLGNEYLVANPDLSVAAWNVRFLAASLLAIGWLLLSVESTTGWWPSKRALVPFVAYVGLGQAIAWSNPYHHLVLTPETTVQGTVLMAVYGPWFWVQSGVNYFLVLTGTVLLAGEWLRSRGLRRRQAAILTLAVVPPVIANLLTLFGTVPIRYDLTPIGLAGSGVFLLQALYRMDLLTVVPVAREVAMAEMDDAVVTIDDEERVLDYNATADRLFAGDDVHVGMPASAFFETLPSTVYDRILEAATHTGDGSEAESIPEETDGGTESAPEVAACGSGSTPGEATASSADADARTEVGPDPDPDHDHDDMEITVEMGDADRHFSVSASTVQRSIDSTAWVIVLRDITPIKRRERELEDREEELELLRQILSRVLRHNIRNKLTTIRGNADLLAEDIVDGMATADEAAIADDAVTADEAVTADDAAIADAEDGDRSEEAMLERIEAIREATEELLGNSENAREIERIIDQRGRVVRYDLEGVVHRVVESVRRDHPDVAVSVERDGPETVTGGPGLETALRCLVENAADHNDAANPAVRVSIDGTDSETIVSVADNGPGIPDNELTVLDTNEETPLSHGSGVGLWLVKWAADSVGARLSIETKGSVSTAGSVADGGDATDTGSTATDAESTTTDAESASIPDGATTVVSLHL